MEDVLELLITLDLRLTQIENSYRDGFYTQIEYINKAKKDIIEFKSKIKRI